MKEYQTEELQKLQKIELEIFKDVADVCEKHGLTYFGIAGTGIGALRHQGIIPWDDDIDIALLRDDYEALNKYVEEELGDKYIVMNCEHEPDYPLTTTRIMKRGTKFREESLKNIKCDLGIFLDIYAYDNVPNDDKLYAKQAREAFIYSKLLILRSIAFPVLVGTKGIKKVLIHSVCGLVHVLMVLFNISKKKLYRKCYEISTRYNGMEGCNRVNYICDTNPYISMYNKKDIFPVVKLPFEDIEMCFPNNMHNNLTGMYGDYMQLPPEDKRKNHYPYELDFGDL